MVDLYKGLVEVNIALENSNRRCYYLALGFTQPTSMTSGSCQWANQSTGSFTLFIDMLICESSFILVCLVSRYLFFWNSR